MEMAMGAWDSDPFGNDTAGDWKYELEATQGFDFIEETLEKALSSGEDYLEAPDAEEAIAAADTIARLRGHYYTRNAYTESLDAWVAQQTDTVPQDLVELALRTLDRVQTEPSELLELWEESGGEDWKEHMQALKERLQAAPKTRGN